MADLKEEIQTLKIQREEVRKILLRNVKCEAIWLVRGLEVSEQCLCWFAGHQDHPAYQAVKPQEIPDYQCRGCSGTDRRQW